MDNAIEKALKTWYEPDNPKYLDPLHPIVKLAGEIGELLDLWAKNEFKPGFDWWQCKRCGLIGVEHNIKGECNPNFLPEKDWVTRYYTPRVLDELGDIWYYLRILAWQNDKDITYDYCHLNDKLDIIVDMYNQANIILQDCQQRFQDISRLKILYGHLVMLLDMFDYTIDQLTELNYRKLNSEPTNHGWKDAA